MPRPQPPHLLPFYSSGTYECPGPWPRIHRLFLYPLLWTIQILAKGSTEIPLIPPLVHISAIFLYPQDRYQSVRHTFPLHVLFLTKGAPLLPLFLGILHLWVLI